MKKRRGTGRARPRTEHSARDRPQAASRPRRWLLIAAAIVCAGAAGLLAVRPFLRSAGSGHDGRSRHDQEEPQHEDSSLPPEFSFPDPAQATISDLADEAVQVALHLSERFPNSPDAHDLAARVHYRFGNSAAAVECWQKCLELDPGFVPAYRGMGSAAGENEEYEQAAALLRKALELDPASTEASNLLANALMNLGRLGEVVAVLEKAVGHNPRSMLSFVLLGQAYLQLREYEKAKQSFLAAVEIDPDSPNAYYGLARACARLGQQAEAAQYQEAFRKLGAGDLDERIGRDKAFDDLRSVRQSAAGTHTDAGRLYARHGDLRAAERLWRRAATLDPKGTLCRIELASLYEQTDQALKALDVCEQLSRIDPQNADYCYNVGLLNARLDRFDAALAAIRRAIELDPHDPRYRQAYELIRKGK